MKKLIAPFFLIITVLLILCGKNRVESLTYAVFPYLPDTDYYEEIIERHWAEIEPDIELVRADWNCYHDGEPDGIDVIMYDAVMQDSLIEKGYIRPIALNEVQAAEDIFPFALEGVTVDGKLYGIPTFLCGNFLIYDRDCADLVKTEHITDLDRESEIFVINSQNNKSRWQYIHEILADKLGEANPSAGSDSDDLMALLDQLAIDAHERDSSSQVPLAYDSGVGKGYIGFSESMRLLSNRGSRTGIKSISFSEQDDLPRLYVDAVAVSSKVKGKRYKKCIELMNVIAEADVLTSLSVQNGAPAYLLLARKSSYGPLAPKFPIYEQLEDLASNENNRTILVPKP